MISRVFPNGFSRETQFLEHSRTVSAEKHSFCTIPERFQPRNTVSGAFPSGFTVETQFLERSRAVSAEKHGFWSVPERFQPINRLPKDQPYPGPFFVFSF